MSDTTSSAFYNGSAVEIRDGALLRDQSTDALVATDVATVDCRILRRQSSAIHRHHLGATVFSRLFRKFQKSRSAVSYMPSDSTVADMDADDEDMTVHSLTHNSSVDSVAHSSDSVITAETMSTAASAAALRHHVLPTHTDASERLPQTRSQGNGACPTAFPANRTAFTTTTAAGTTMNGGASVAPKVAFEMSATADRQASPVRGGAGSRKKIDTQPTCCRFGSGRGASVVIACSRMQLALAAMCALATVFASVAITYALTKNGGERYQRHAIARSGGDSAVAAAHVATSRLLTKDDFDMTTITRRNDEPLEEEDKSLVEAANTSLTGEPSAEELRLSTNLAPLWYNLTMKVYVPGFVPLSDEESLTFNANLTLRFIVLRPTSTIELNALKLNIPVDPKAIHLIEADKEDALPLKVLNITVNETLEKLFFDLERNLTAKSQYLIQIPYSGPIAKKLSGLYITQYTTRDGQQRYAAVTQMEPTDARRVVPCFDEPSFKAVWNLTVIHPRGSRAVSNGIEDEENVPTGDDNWLKTTFQPTLPMSSYLLALVVSEFEYVEGRTVRNTRFRIWARSDALNFTSYALSAGIKVLEFYEDYYGIPFPLPKQDMMAFPDFAAGAMENWGLVTYREKYLLYSADLYTLQQKLAVASVVSHELAHQWFGNLVTMKWWSDLWLNEGFATLMEYLGTDAISGGDFRMDEYFMVESLDSAFDRDARATSHPLFFAINRAEDVSEAFDSITYSKGASVLRMIRAVMGEEFFKTGLNIYLNRYKFHNANYKNLWSTLTEAVPSSLCGANGERFDVSDFAQSWTEQMGYPVVVVHEANDTNVVLSQERFKLDQSAQEKAKFQDAKYGYKWSIPIWYNINGQEKQLSWLTNDSSTTLGNIGPTDLLVVNSDSHGFYRVEYSNRTREQIIYQLLHNHTIISVKSRARIIDDTFKLAEAGRVPYAAALNLTRYLSRERDYLPWQMALNGLTVIQNYFGDEPEADYFRVYVKQLIGDLFEKEIHQIFNASFDNNSKFFENLLSLRIIQKVCSLRDQQCINKIIDLYRTKFAEPCAASSSRNTTTVAIAATPVMSSECSQVPVPLRTLTYCEGIHYGSENDFDAVMELYKHEAVQVERERLMMALACSRDTHTLKKLLALASDINSTVIRLQDKPSVFSAISSRIIGQRVVVDFFLDHWPQLYKDFKEQQTLLRSIIANSIVGNSQRLIDEVEKFVRNNSKTTKNLDIFKQRLEVIKTNRKWIEQNFRPLSEWFQQQTEPREKDL